jgi:hypothetical protein
MENWKTVYGLKVRPIGVTKQNVAVIYIIAFLGMLMNSWNSSF